VLVYACPDCTEDFEFACKTCVQRYVDTNPGKKCRMCNSDYNLKPKDKRPEQPHWVCMEGAITYRGSPSYRQLELTFEPNFLDFVDRLCDLLWDAVQQKLFPFVEMTVGRGGI